MTASGDAAPPRELRGLATALYLLLSAQLVAGALNIAVTVRLYVLAERVRSDEGVFSVFIDSAVSFADYVGVLMLVLFVATAITWIRWLYRARANVDAWGADNQRLGAGWVIGGWFVPFGNLMVPAVVTIDVCAGTDEVGGRGRTRQPLAVAWGLAFGLAAVLWSVARILRPGVPALDSLDGAVIDGLLAEFAFYELLDVAVQVVTLVAIGVAMALVGSLTRRQTALIERRDLSRAG